MELQTTARNFLETLNMLGLPMDSKTGGQCMPELYGKKVGKTPSDLYHVDLGQGTGIIFLDGFFFLKTIKLTESSLQLKLFS